MLRTFAVLALGVAMIAWGTQFMAKQHSATRAGMLEDLASGLINTFDDVVSNDSAVTPVADAEAEQFTIGGTDGSGVALRDDCLDDARVEGALPEGTAVTRLNAGEGRCAGWSLVQHLSADADVQTWVRDEYLEAPTTE